MSYQSNEGTHGGPSANPSFPAEPQREPRKQKRSWNPFRTNRRKGNEPAEAGNPPVHSAHKDPVEIFSAEHEHETSEGMFTEFGLDQRLERAVQEAGFISPTPVQSAVIPAALAGADIIGTAQTGTGKTAAFILPILQHLLTSPVKKRRTRAIIVTPTRELAEQVHECFVLLARHTKIRSATVYGGVGMNPQTNALRSGVEVIVACPGRLIDHMERGNTDFSEVELLVLDEADRMLDMGFLPQIRRILSRLPRERQSMLFSATFAPELTHLAESTMNSPERIDIGLRAPVQTVAHALYPCPHDMKTPLVLSILANMDANSVLIFTRTKHRADRVAQQIRRTGYRTAVLHADKSQGQRQTALADFRSGRCQILVATDIAARGLDVETISHVINYDVPDSADTYIHRVGRTGRAERKGDAITLITWEDSEFVWDIERAFGSPIERRKLDGFDYGTAVLPSETGRPQPAASRRRRARAVVPVSGVSGPRAPLVYSTPRRRARAGRSGAGT